MGLKSDAGPRSTFSICGALARAVFRLLQMVMALAVAGLYGTDINTARQNNIAADSRWVYAETVAGLSAITAIIYMIPFVKSRMAFGWDVVLFLLWIVVFGIFGKMYVGADAGDDPNLLRMKNAVWVDLFNCCLWFFSAIYGTTCYFRNRSRAANMPTFIQEEV